MPSVKALDKIQYPFLIKTLSKIINWSFLKPASNLKEKHYAIPTKVKNKARILTISISI